MDDVSGKGVVPKDAATLNSDIGFAILLKRTDGTLPMLLPYKYVYLLNKKVACISHLLQSGVFVGP